MFSNDNKRTFNLGLDAGHGGPDPGTIHDGIKEKNVTLQLTRDLYNFFYYYKFNIQAHYTRLDNKSLTLKERGNLFNDLNLDLVISIHCNSAENALAKGALAFIYPGNGKTSLLAHRLLHNMPWELRRNKSEPIEVERKSWTRRAYNVVTAFKASTILLETGFLSNKDDRDFLTSSRGRFAICSTIIRTITDYAHENEQSSHP